MMIGSSLGVGLFSSSTIVSSFLNLGVVSNQGVVSSETISFFLNLAGVSV